MVDIIEYALKFGVDFNIGTSESTKSIENNKLANRSTNKSAKYFKTSSRYKNTVKKDVIITKIINPIPEPIPQMLSIPIPSSPLPSIPVMVTNIQDITAINQTTNLKDHDYIINKVSDTIYQNIINKINDELISTSEKTEQIVPLSYEHQLQLQSIIQNEQRYQGLLSIINVNNNTSPKILMTPEDNILDDTKDSDDTSTKESTISSASCIYLNDTTLVYNKYFNKFDIMLYEKPPNIKEISQKALLASKTVNTINLDHLVEYGSYNNTISEDILHEALHTKKCIYLGLWDPYSNLPYLKPYTNPDNTPFYIYHSNDNRSNIIYYDKDEWTKFELNDEDEGSINDP